jgi:hypothetical protein
MKLIDRLPKSYKELNYKKYVAIMDRIPAEKPANMDATDWAVEINMITLTILLDCQESDIEALQASEVFAMLKVIAFMDYDFERDKKPRYEVKSVNELTYDEFVTYQRLRLDQWNNLGDILLLVVKGSTPEQIDAMSIYDAMQVFFCLSKSTTKFLTRLKYSALRKVITRTIAERFLALRLRLGKA